MPLAKLLGVLGLVTYITTLLPSIVKFVFPSTKKSILVKFLFKYRRQTGVTAFVFGLGHGLLLIKEKHLDLLSLETYSKYSLGFATLFILTLLAITSNNWSVKKLKQSWKQLHSLTYLVMFLLLGHILAEMTGRYSYLTHFEIWNITTVIILFTTRKVIELKPKFNKIKDNSFYYNKQQYFTFVSSQITRKYITSFEIWSLLTIVFMYLRNRRRQPERKLFRNSKIKRYSKKVHLETEKLQITYQINSYITEFEFWSKTAIIVLFFKMKSAELKGKPINRAKAYIKPK